MTQQQQTRTSCRNEQQQQKQGGKKKKDLARTGRKRKGTPNIDITTNYSKNDPIRQKPFSSIRQKHDQGKSKLRKREYHSKIPKQSCS